MLVLLGFVIGSVLFGPAAYRWWTKEELAPSAERGRASVPSVTARKSREYPQQRGVSGYQPPRYYSSGTPDYSSSTPGMEHVGQPPIYAPEQYQQQYQQQYHQPYSPAFGVPRTGYPSGSSNSINIGGYKFRNPDKDRVKRRAPARSDQLAARGYSVPQWPPQQVPRQSTPSPYQRYSGGWGSPGYPTDEYAIGNPVQRSWDYTQPRFRPLDRTRQRYTGGINVGQPQVPLQTNEQHHLWTYENLY